MKLRVSGNSIRLRLSRSEVARLEKESHIDERIEFGSGTLSYSIAANSDAGPCASYGENEIRIQVPRRMAESWASSDQVAMSAEQPLADGRTLQILVEKDFKCIHKDAAANEDAYPNPCAPELR